jgi:tetratricopeptide (TPR) repeat protein
MVRYLFGLLQRPLLTLATLAGQLALTPALAEGHEELTTYEYYVHRCQKGSDREAVVACEKALALRPDDVSTWTNLGVRLGNLGDYEAALAAHNRALRLRPRYALALLNRCADQIALGRWIEAVSSCESALEGDGRWGELSAAIAWYNLGLAQQGLDRYPQSREALMEAIALDPEQAAAWNRLGYAWERLGDYDEALEAYRRAVELAPTTPRYREDLNLVQRRLQF